MKNETRMQIAAIALSGILSRSYSSEGHTQSEIDRMAEDALVFADAIIAKAESKDNQPVDEFLNDLP